MSAAAAVAAAAVAGAENVVVVAVRAEMEMSKTALAWALTHIVRPGDLVTLLAVLPDRDATSAAPGSGIAASIFLFLKRKFYIR